MILSFYRTFYNGLFDFFFKVVERRRIVHEMTRIDVACNIDNSSFVFFSSIIKIDRHHYTKCFLMFRVAFSFHRNPCLSILLAECWLKKASSFSFFFFFFFFFFSFCGRPSSSEPNRLPLRPDAESPSSQRKVSCFRFRIFVELLKVILTRYM